MSHIMSHIVHETLYHTICSILAFHWVLNKIIKKLMHRNYVL